MKAEEAVVYCQKELLDGHFLKEKFVAKLFENSSSNDFFGDYLVFNLVEDNSMLKPFETQFNLPVNSAKEMLERDSVFNVLRDRFRLDMEELCLMGDLDSTDPFLSLDNGLLMKSQRAVFSEDLLAEEDRLFFCHQETKKSLGNKNNIKVSTYLPRNVVLAPSKLPKRLTTDVGFDCIRTNICKNVQCNIALEKMGEDDYVSMLLTLKIGVYTGHSKGQACSITPFTLYEIPRR